MNENLMNDLHLMLGRLNGLHAAVLTIARTLPAAQAATAAAAMQEGAERVHSDALASPVSDVQITEMRRVLMEVTSVLQQAARDH